MNYRPSRRLRTIEVAWYGVFKDGSLVNEGTSHAQEYMLRDDAEKRARGYQITCPDSKIEVRKRVGPLPWNQ